MFDKLSRIFGLSLHVRGKKTGLHQRILIVDDSELDRKILQKILGTQGFQVIEAVDGPEGLRKAALEKPDLIIMDCQMPGMMGPEVCRLLKDRHETKDIPVLFLTGLDTPKNIIECFDADAENYLAKPVNPRILTSQIDMILEEHSGSH